MICFAGLLEDPELLKRLSHLPGVTQSGADEQQRKEEKEKKEEALAAPPLLEEGLSSNLPLGAGQQTGADGKAKYLFRCAAQCITPMAVTSGRLEIT
jgi:hypothetical protein